MKTKSLIAVLLISCTTAFAGPQESPNQIIDRAQKWLADDKANAALFADSEFNISVLGTGAWTQTDAKSDRYFGADHGYGGTINAKYFFARYFGVGVSASGYSVKNVLGPNFGGTHRFVGTFEPTFTVRYPLGSFAPYVFVGAGGIFNGGNSALVEPSNGSVGRKLRFEKAEHDTQVLAEGGIGVEYRVSKNIGIVTEAAFDKVGRPQSNFGSIRAGVNIAF